jgi:shikimate dehydrogenase
MQVKLYGLIGYPLEHSFSESYFKEKFLREGIKNYSYENMEIPCLYDFIDSVKTDNYPNFEGFNVTMPYKEKIIPYLDVLDDTAKEIGAVNTVTIKRQNGIIILKGYNTDAIGFEQSLFENLENNRIKALILGTGGASKAVAYVLRKHNIEYSIISRQKRDKEGYLTYKEINTSLLSSHKLIINATPLGMYPNIGEMPPIDIQQITNQHIVFDLIYNPSQTLLLSNCQIKGAKIINGFDMLCYQAQESWRIWNAN